MSKKVVPSPASSGRRVLLGHVGVDSGQLLLLDPAYIKSQWISEDQAPAVAVRFWGPDAGAVADEARVLWPESDIQDYGKHARWAYRLTMNDIGTDGYSLIAGQLESLVKNVTVKVDRPSTYEQICQLTQGDNQGGSLPYKTGHEGFAVAFTSGCGDGLYPVYATYEDVPGFGERITSITVDLS